MNNPIYNQIIEERKGHYCHCVEVSNVYELEAIAESIIEEFEEHGEKVVIEFLGSLDVYYLDGDEITEQENKEQEKQVYDFCFSDYIKDTM